MQVIEEDIIVDKMKNSAGDVESRVTTNEERPAWEAVMPRYRQAWEERHRNDPVTWADVEDAYRYAYEIAQDARYHGRTWVELEPDFRNEWSQRYPNRPWNVIYGALQDAWSEITGRH